MKVTAELTTPGLEEEEEGSVHLAQSGPPIIYWLDLSPPLEAAEGGRGGKESRRWERSRRPCHPDTARNRSQGSQGGGELIAATAIPPLL